MSRIITWLFTLLVFVNFLSCKQKSEEEVLTAEELDVMKTKELLIQLFQAEKESVFSYHCIEESPMSSGILQDLDYINDPYEYLNQLDLILDINNSEHSEQQLKAFKEFKITKDLAPNKKIISDSLFDAMRAMKVDPHEAYEEILGSKCRKGWIGIGKPLFNETFDKALVVVGMETGGMGIMRSQLIYSLQNKKWVYQKSLSPNDFF